MRRRKLLAVGLAVLVAVGVVALWPRQDRATLDNYHRIELGSSQAEVEALLGPPGDYTTSPVLVSRESPCDYVYTYAVADFSLEWSEDNGKIEVEFNASGKGIFKRFRPCTPDCGWTLSTAVWRAKRQWRKWFPYPVILAFLGQTGEFWVKTCL
jgi:hypothetical protein